MSNEIDTANTLVDTLDLTPPINLNIVAQTIGLDIDNTLDWDNINTSGRIDVKNKKIWINPTDNERRSRFTLAHEIGHYILHKDISTNPDNGSYEPSAEFFRNAVERNILEKQANTFAATLLMPKKYIISHAKMEIEKHKATTTQKMKKEDLITALANTFNVSEDAIGWRLHNLGIISKY